MAVSECWGYICDECGTGDDGYDTEMAALRAEIAHMGSPGCGADPDEVREKRDELAELDTRAAALPAETAVGYALAVRYEDGGLRLDPQGTLIPDLPTAASTCEAVQGGAERRGWGERWFVVKLTEVTGDA